MVLNDYERTFIVNAIQGAHKNLNAGGIISLDLFVNHEGRIEGRTVALFRQCLPGTSDSMNGIYRIVTGGETDREKYERLKAKYELGKE